MGKIREVYFKDNKQNKKVEITEIRNKIFNKLEEKGIFLGQSEITVNHWQKKYLFPGNYFVFLDYKFHDGPPSYQELTLTIEHLDPLDEIRELIKKHKVRKA